VPLLATNALSKRYPNGVLALDALTVDVEPGVIGLVGANGAGKSTLIKILLGLLPPTAGSASVLDLDPDQQGERVRAVVGYMPEHDCLPSDVSATEFVVHMSRMSGLPLNAARERAAEALRLVGGYSTGMKQRVKLAQSIVHDPQLLLLDEPTNGLDPAGRNDMLGLIRRIGSEFGISILVSSHLLSEIELICDSLIVIDGGKLLRHDTLAAFTERREVLLVQVDEGIDELAAALATTGLQFSRDGDGLLVPLDGDDAYDVIRDTVAELRLPLHRLEQRRHRVEEVFR
jgi:ABC-2 type transport system ATP-binding protein